MKVINKQLKPIAILFLLHFQKSWKRRDKELKWGTPPLFFWEKYFLARIELKIGKWRYNLVAISMPLSEFHLDPAGTRYEYLPERFYLIHPQKMFIQYKVIGNSIWYTAQGKFILWYNVRDGFIWYNARNEFIQYTARRGFIRYTCKRRFIQHIASRNSYNCFIQCQFLS